MLADMNDDLAYFATPGLLTDTGSSAGSIDALPDDVGALARVVQGLLVHRAWAGAYRFEPPKERLGEEGLHSAEAMLRRITELDSAPLEATRPPERRMLANCRHFSTLLCAMLRRKRVRARARCGFATYFERGKHVDHWVCEYWREDEGRWALADAQLDPLQVAVLKPDFDPLDVPRDRFLVAGEAWRRCRAGEADPATFGIAHMWGRWYVRGNLMLDLASLQKIELLPWEPYGVTTTYREQDSTPHDALFDRVAALTADASPAALLEVRALVAFEAAALQVPAELLDRVAAADAAGVRAGANPLAT